MADFLGGGSENKPLVAGGLDIQTSTSIIAIPICWGTNTLSGNLIFANDFQFHDNSGGKGFGGKGGASFYSANLMIAFCRGVTSGVPIAYEGSQIHIDSALTTSWLASISATEFFGSYPDQAVWDTTLPNSGYAGLSYPSISGIAIPNFNLGGSPSPPNFNYVLSCNPAQFAPYSSVFIGVIFAPNPSFGPVGGDPALIIADLINGEIAAGRGFPGLGLDLRTLLTADAVDPANDSTYQTWCYANSVDFSPFLRQAEKASGILDRWASFMFFEIGYWDGMLKILPRGDAAATGNGRTFTPASTPIFAFTVDDFVTQDGDMPVKISTKAPEDIPNVVRLEVINAVNEWSPAQIEVRNEVDFFGIGSILRVLPTIQAHEITNPTLVAPFLANLILKKNQNIINTFEFKLGPGLGDVVTPMDIVSITDLATGLSDYVVRITSVASDNKGIVTVEAEDYLQGTSSATLFGGGASLATSTNTNITPDPVNTPIIYEPPSTLLSPASLLFIVSGGFGDQVDPNWGGANIFASVGGGAYAQQGQINKGPGCQGVLTASLATFSGVNPDMTHTLSVDLNECGRALTTFPTASAAAGASVCIVDQELIGYTTATLTTITISVQELQRVPATGPFSITVNGVSNFTANVSVHHTGGAALTLVGSAPAMGQYTEAAGVYGFNAGDANAAVTIAYTRSGPGYNLTGLYRGMFGTAPAAHSMGALFGFIDSDPAVISFPVPASFVGQTVDFKFQSYNIFGTGLQDLSTCVVYPYTLTGAGFGGGPGVPTVPTGLAASSATAGTTTASVVASEALAAGAIVNVWNNSGTANVRNANATDGTKPAHGFVLASVAMGGTAVVQCPGQRITGLSGLTPGAAYFLDTTNGAITLTGPSTTGNLNQIVGVASSATVLDFAPTQGVGV